MIRRHIPLYMLNWERHNPRLTGAVWDNDLSPLAFSSAANILPYTVYTVEHRTCRYVDYPAASIVYGAFADKNEIFAVTSEGLEQYRRRYEPHIRLVLQPRRLLRTLPKFAAHERCSPSALLADIPF